MLIMMFFVPVYLDSCPSQTHDIQCNNNNDVLIFNISDEDGFGLYFDFHNEQKSVAMY